MLSLLSTLSLFTVCASPLPTQHALLIGVSQYKNPNIRKLSSDSDIAKLKQALVTWNFEDIRIATSSSQTSRTGINREMQSLLTACKPGDVVYLHFSGHGTRVPDEPGHPAHADGLEHCICPYDTEFLTGGAVDPKTLILGSDIGAWLQKFRSAGIKNLAISFDSCHSAGSTRAIGAVARELPNPAVDSIASVKQNSEREDQHFGLGNFVALYAARSEQKAYEEPDGSGGRFSSALAQALGHEAHSGMSYSQLLQQVNSYLHERSVGDDDQDAQGEGMLSNAIFAGRANPKPLLFPVRFAPGGAILSAGKLRGITNNSLIEIYATPTPPTQAVGQLRVTRTSALESVLVSDSSGGTKALNYIEEHHGAWGKVVHWGAGDFEILTYIGGLKDPADKQLWDQIAKQFTLLTPTTDAAHYDLAIEKLLPSKNGSPKVSVPSYALSTYGGRYFADTVPTINADASRLIGNTMQSAIQWMALKKINDNPGAPLHADVVLQRVNVDWMDEFGSKTTPNASGASPVFNSLKDSAQTISDDEEIHPGEFFIVRVRSAGTPYISAIALEPRINVRAQFPLSSEIQHNENKIPEAGKWFCLQNFPIPRLIEGAPTKDVQVFTVSTDPAIEGAGTEYFKVFATEKPMDISLITDRDLARGEKNLDTQDPLAKFINSMTAGTRDPVLPFSGKWGLTTRRYMICDPAHSKT